MTSWEVRFLGYMALQEFERNNLTVKYQLLDSTKNRKMAYAELVMLLDETVINLHDYDFISIDDWPQELWRYYVITIKVLITA